MYIDNENFEKWMATLSKKLTEIGQDLKSLINTDTVLDENEKLLDNQDLAFLLKASFRTLQRYRAKGKLPYFTIGRKTYYRASDIRAFVREFADYQAVLVDRIMIEDIILLKLSRVIYKVIVYGIITNYDIRIVDNGIQINSLIIVGTRICFRIHCNYFFLYV